MDENPHGNDDLAMSCEREVFASEMDWTFANFSPIMGCQDPRKIEVFVNGLGRPYSNWAERG